MFMGKNHSTLQSFYSQWPSTPPPFPGPCHHWEPLHLWNLTHQHSTQWLHTSIPPTFSFIPSNLLLGFSFISLPPSFFSQPSAVSRFHLLLHHTQPRYITSSTLLQPSQSLSLPSRPICAAKPSSAGTGLSFPFSAKSPDASHPSFSYSIEQPPLPFPSTAIPNLHYSLQDPTWPVPSYSQPTLSPHSEREQRPWVSILIYIPPSQTRAFAPSFHTGPKLTPHPPRNIIPSTIHPSLYSLPLSLNLPFTDSFLLTIIILPSLVLCNSPDILTLLLFLKP